MQGGFFSSCQYIFLCCNCHEHQPHFLYVTDNNNNNNNNNNNKNKIKYAGITAQGHLQNKHEYIMHKYTAELYRQNKSIRSKEIKICA